MFDTSKMLDIVDFEIKRLDELMDGWNECDVVRVYIIDIYISKASIVKC